MSLNKETNVARSNRGDVAAEAIRGAFKLSQGQKPGNIPKDELADMPGSNLRLRTSDFSPEQRRIDRETVKHLAMGGSRRVVSHAPVTSAYYAPSLASQPGADDGWVRGRRQATHALEAQGLTRLIEAPAVGEQTLEQPEEPVVKAA